MTYFFNGGREEPYPGEDRRLVPSPKVATYDLQPEMSAPAVAGRGAARPAQAGEHDVIVVNFANGDMVGHTGVFEAAVTAMQTLDRLLAEIMPPSLARGTVWLVTADHGNCDEMLDPDGQGPDPALAQPGALRRRRTRICGQIRPDCTRRSRAGRHRPDHPPVARIAPAGRDDGTVYPQKRTIVIPVDRFFNVTVLVFPRRPCAIMRPVSVVFQRTPPCAHRPPPLPRAYLCQGVPKDEKGTVLRPGGRLLPDRHRRGADHRRDPVLQSRSPARPPAPTPARPSP